MVVSRTLPRLEEKAMLLPSGFSATGEAVVAARPDADEEGIVQKDSCVTKTGIWIVDPADFGIRQVRDEFKVKKYGKKGG